MGNRGDADASRRGSWKLTFLQRFDLVLREGGPVPLQLPLQLEPHLGLLGVLAGGTRGSGVLPFRLWTL